MTKHDTISTEIFFFWEHFIL